MFNIPHLVNLCRVVILQRLISTAIIVACGIVGIIRIQPDFQVEGSTCSHEPYVDVVAVLLHLQHHVVHVVVTVLGILEGVTPSGWALFNLRCVDMNFGLSLGFRQRHNPVAVVAVATLPLHPFAQVFILNRQITRVDQLCNLLHIETRSSVLRNLHVIVRNGTLRTTIHIGIGAKERYLIAIYNEVVATRIGVQFIVSLGLGIFVVVIVVLVVVFSTTCLGVVGLSNIVATAIISNRIAIIVIKYTIKIQISTVFTIEFISMTTLDTSCVSVRIIPLS